MPTACPLGGMLWGWRRDCSKPWATSSGDVPIFQQAQAPGRDRPIIFRAGQQGGARPIIGLLSGYLGPGGHAQVLSTGGPIGVDSGEGFEYTFPSRCMTRRELRKSTLRTVHEILIV